MEINKTPVAYFFHELADIKKNVPYELQAETITNLYAYCRRVEKEMLIEFAEFVAKYPNKNKNANNEMLHAKSKYDGAERTVDLLDEFYIQNFNEYARKQN
jgi:hypothetical protein